MKLTKNNNKIITLKIFKRSEIQKLKFIFLYQNKQMQRIKLLLNMLKSK